MALYYGLTWDFMGVNGKKWIIYDKLGLFVDNFLLEFTKIMNFFCQMAYKPGSVSTKWWWSFILGLCHHKPLATYPNSIKRDVYITIPIWFCSQWGLPCQICYHIRGALLPHLFTLTIMAVYFLWHFPWGRPRRALPGTVSLGARTFLT